VHATKCMPSMVIFWEARLLLEKNSCSEGSNKIRGLNTFASETAEGGHGRRGGWEGMEREQERERERERKRKTNTQRQTGKKKEREGTQKRGKGAEKEKRKFACETERERERESDTQITYVYTCMYQPVFSAS